MPQVDAGIGNVNCLKHFLETEMYKISFSSWNQKCTLCQEVAGTRYVHCVKYLLEPKKKSNSSISWDQRFGVFQEECARLRESVPYFKLYRYNPKHLYPKSNVYGDNGQRILKFWQLLLIYWLPNTHWNWHEYVVSVMLIAVRNIKVTCEWHKTIKLNYKSTRTRVIFVLRLPSNLRRPQLMLSCDVRASVRGIKEDRRVSVYASV